MGKWVCPTKAELGERAPPGGLFWWWKQKSGKGVRLGSGVSESEEEEKDFRLKLSYKRSQDSGVLG